MKKKTQQYKYKSNYYFKFLLIIIKHSRTDQLPSNLIQPLKQTHTAKLLLNKFVSLMNFKINKKKKNTKR